VFAVRIAKCEKRKADKKYLQPERGAAFP
jgi:hypothetical protein